MFRSYSLWLVCVISILYAAAGPVQAGAVVELRYADFSGAPIQVPSQGFSPGDQFLVELWMKPDQDIAMNQMIIDYRASSPELIPGFGLDINTVNQPLDGIPNFWFDYSGTGLGTYPANGFVEPLPGFFVSTTADYADFSDVSTDRTGSLVPVVTFTTNTTPGGNLITYTGGLFTRVGGMPITIPKGISPGLFNVDLLGSPDGMIDNYNNGSSILFGFGSSPEDRVTIWANATDDRSVDGSLAYAPGAGPLVFAVTVPEPATILLLAFGLCFVMRTIKKRHRFA